MKHWLPAINVLGLLLTSGLFTSESRANELDRIVSASQKASEGKKIDPMPLVDDSVFLRRIYVDLIGRIATDA